MCKLSGVMDSHRERHQRHWHKTHCVTQLEGLYAPASDVHLGKQIRKTRSEHLNPEVRLSAHILAIQRNINAHALVISQESQEWKEVTKDHCLQIRERKSEIRNERKNSGMSLQEIHQEWGENSSRMRERTRNQEWEKERKLVELEQRVTIRTHRTEWIAEELAVTNGIRRNSQDGCFLTDLWHDLYSFTHLTHWFGQNALRSVWVNFVANYFSNQRSRLKRTGKERHPNLCTDAGTRKF